MVYGTWCCTWVHGVALALTCVNGVHGFMDVWVLRVMGVMGSLVHELMGAWIHELALALTWFMGLVSP